MQIVLKRDVEKLGRMGDIVTVRPGYARNYLLAKGLAALVTPNTVRQVDAQKKREMQAQAERESAVRQTAGQLDGSSCTITATANEEGRLFGSVDAAQIVDALAGEGFQVQQRQIQLEEPIRDLGVYEIRVSFTPDLFATCKVWIVAK